MLKTYYSYSFSSIEELIPHINACTNIELFFNDGDKVQTEPWEGGLMIVNGNPEKFFGEVVLYVDGLKSLEGVFGCYAESYIAILTLQHQKHLYVDYLATLEYLGDCVTIEESECVLSNSGKRFILLPSVTKYNFDLASHVYKTYEVDFLGTSLGNHLSQKIVHAFETMRDTERDIVVGELSKGDINSIHVIPRLPKNIRELTKDDPETGHVLLALDTLEKRGEMVKSLENWRKSVM